MRFYSIWPARAGGPPQGDKIYTASSGGVRIMAYDREIYPGVDYIKIFADCNMATRKSGSVRLLFEERFPGKSDYGYRSMEGKGLVASPEDRTRFEKTSDEWVANSKIGNGSHMVALPDSYMERINEYAERVYRLGSLAVEALRRFGLEKEESKEKRREAEWPQDLRDM